MARSVSSSVIAGAFRKFFVPYATFRCSTPGISLVQFTPISTGITFVGYIRPATSAILHTEVMPFPIFSTTMAVTSCPVWLTCSSTMPLSAHITITARFSNVKSAVPRIPPICANNSSKSPIPSNGFATLSQRSFVAFFAA